MVAAVPTQVQSFAKLLQIRLPEGVWPPWLQLKCNLSIPKPWNHPDLGLVCVLFIICLGHAGHCAHRGAYLCKSATNTPARKGRATLVTT